jgi:hypothetical protein
VPPLKATSGALTAEPASRLWVPPANTSVVPASPVKVLPLLAVPPPDSCNVPAVRFTTPVPAPPLVLLKAIPILVVPAPDLV